MWYITEEDNFVGTDRKMFILRFKGFHGPISAWYTRKEAEQRLQECVRTHYDPTRFEQEEKPNSKYEVEWINDLSNYESVQKKLNELTKWEIMIGESCSERNSCPPVEEYINNALQLGHRYRIKLIVEDIGPAKE